MPDLVKIRVYLKNAPWEEPAEQWTFSNTPDGDASLPVNELELEAALRKAFIDAGGANTLSMSRTSSWGGWGADGLTVLDIVITVSISVGSAALYDGIKLIFKRLAGVEPDATRDLPTAAEDATPKLPEAEEGEATPAEADTDHDDA